MRAGSSSNKAKDASKSTRPKRVLLPTTSYRPERSVVMARSMSSAVGGLALNSSTAESMAPSTASGVLLGSWMR